MKNNKQIIRKKNRLKGYDYSSNASYFLTVCSDKRKEIFSQIVYPCVFVDNYIIMPNHIHLILTIDTRRRPMVAPTISTIIKQFKGAVSKEIGTSIWQKGYYDHIIRDDDDYSTKSQYINTNPFTWERDELFTER